MFQHYERGHEGPTVLGDLSFFLGIVTPICLFHRTSPAFTLAVVAGNLAWLGFLLFAHLRARKPHGKIGKLLASEYFYASLFAYAVAGLFSAFTAWYLTRRG